MLPLKYFASVEVYALFDGLTADVRGYFMSNMQFFSHEQNETKLTIPSAIFIFFFADTAVCQRFYFKGETQNDEALSKDGSIFEPSPFKLKK